MLPHPSPPPVGSRAGAPAVGGGFPALLFRLQDGFTVPPWPRFQPPPRQTQRADFPHCAFLLASYQGLWDLSCWDRFQPWSLPPVICKTTQGAEPATASSTSSNRTPAVSVHASDAVAPSFPPNL